MDIATAIVELQHEWDLDRGFFGCLRRGHFDTDGLNRLLNVLSQVCPLEGPTIDRRFVSLIWYMPGFMEWQRHRVEKAGGDITEFESAVNRIRTLVEEVLGVP